MRSCTRLRISFLDLCGITLLFLSADSRLQCCFTPRTSFEARGTHTLFRAGLADFLLQLLSDVTHTLLLVRVRRTQAAHLSRDLADLLAVDAIHGQARLLGIDRDVNAARQWVFD